MTVETIITFVNIFIPLLIYTYVVGVICYEKGKLDGEVRGLWWVEMVISIKRKTRKTVDNQQSNLAQN